MDGAAKIDTVIVAGSMERHGMLGSLERFSSTVWNMISYDWNGQVNRVDLRICHERNRAINCASGALRL